MAFWYEWEILPRNGGWIKKYLGNTNVKDGFCSPKFRGEGAKKEPEKKKKRLKRIVLVVFKAIPRLGDLIGLTGHRSHYTHNYGLLPWKIIEQN